MKTMSLDAFCRHLATRPAAARRARQDGLRDAAEMVEVEARGLLGTYQPAVGPFPAWAELAESTKEERVEAGYAPNDPLFRSGELRDTIGLAVAEDRAAVGSDSRTAVWMERGNGRIPPRPFLGPAGFRMAEPAANAVGYAVARAIAGLPRDPTKHSSREDVPF